MSKHKGAPHQQEFNVTARPNKNKKNSWWSVQSSNYWRSKKDARKPEKGGRA